MTHKHQPKQDSLSSMHEYRGVAKNRLALAIGVTGSVMVLEVVGSVLTGSLALGSDAGHMFTHLFALVISFVAICLACREPCHHRTYGFYRVEILAALFNSLFLFAVTGYILFEGIERLLNPQPVIGFEMLIVALLGLAANGLSILILRGSTKNDLNIRGAFLHMFADTASSVVIIFGAILVSLTNWYIIDPLMGIGISVLIFVWAWGLFRDSVNVLLETAPKGMNIDDISAELKKNIPDIVKITDMHIWEITSNMYSFTAHIQIGKLDYAKSKEVIDRINKVLDQKYGIEHTTIQLEPTS
ncbi:MAG: cation diffusion facilitator family transporter [Candidatus Bathyarchaeota archaeon]|nr:cation diffusion facilitator family transporter [Candidatus Bathyarchaeota archaeon]